ncbi:MAG: tetratricopeptide repeat protein [Candidatus Poribacteria bacterium]
MRKAGVFQIIVLIILLLFVISVFGQFDIKPQEAVDYYLKKIRSQPDNLVLHRDLVDTYKEKGMINIPIDIYIRAVANNPDNPIVYYVLGYAYLSYGTKESLALAEKNLTKALELKPNFPDAISALGDYYLKIGNEEMAMEKWQEAKKSNEKFEPAYISMARYYRSKRQYEKALAEYEDAIALKSPLIGKRYLELGEMLMEMGNLNKAEEMLIKAKNYEPKIGMIYYKLGQIYAKKGNKDQAIRFYRDGRKYDPNNAQVAYDLAMIFLERNETKYALLSIERGLTAENVDQQITKELLSRIDKGVAKGIEYLTQLADTLLLNNFNVQYFLGKVHLKQKNDDLALKYFKRASSMPNANADVFYQLGLIYEKNQPKLTKTEQEKVSQKPELHKENLNITKQSDEIKIEPIQPIQPKIDDAQEQYRKAVELGSEEASLLFKVAQGYLDEGNEDKFIEVAQKALILDNNNIEFHKKLAEIFQKRALNYKKEGKSDEEEKAINEAIKHYEQVVLLEPTAQRWYNLGLLYEYAGKSKAIKAVTAYDQAIQLKPDFALAYYRRGYFRLTYKVGAAKVLMYKPEVAVEDLKKAIEYDPNLADAYVALGLAYNQMDMPEQATAEFEKAIKVDPNNLRAHIYLAQDYDKIGDYQKVIFHLSRAVELDDSNPQVLKSYAGMLLKYGSDDDTSKARDILAKAIQMLPDDAEVNMNYGYTLYLESKFNEAIKYLKKALEIQPNYAEANYNIGLAYSRIGEYKLAKQHWEKVIEQAPDTPMAAKAADFVDKIKKSESNKR